TTFILYTVLALSFLIYTAYKSVGGKVILGTANVAAIMTTPSAVKALKTSRNWVSSIALSWNKVASADAYI
ncbi:hypothetical protein NE628_15540, partial [Coprococcus eutactus]|uniref:hypothetical protein n=1 Tax=Coprococcus eutactus TaxID=33043 RepID=UPI00210D905D